MTGLEIGTLLYGFGAGASCAWMIRRYRRAWPLTSGTQDVMAALVWSLAWPVTVLIVWRGTQEHKGDG